MTTGADDAGGSGCGHGENPENGLSSNILLSIFYRDGVGRTKMLQIKQAESDHVGDTSEIGDRRNERGSV